MSAESAILSMLLANTTLAALVDDDSIEPGVLSQGAAYPALVVSAISTVPGRLNVREAAREYLESRVQVSALAETYPQVKQLLNAVRGACGNRRGTFNGVDVVNCRADLQGPDLKTPDDVAFLQTLDLIVLWRRAL